ncbi:uncharacterized protein LOC124131328 isoform X1 [Haliotis rufescens]|uniref:uncharacterized protein LOC124131328 isoform X1 n=2 Tax=Haliotis rufescens TaxID=6454 RepID=UPI00201F5545|nr:uncharacterized protein LOC124131328 isoform X1 [Haliotis rufescens]XP_046350493.2 uncharacterized protein LOC124131328 isoform X1 [Haliotis rufescens]
MEEEERWTPHMLCWGCGEFGQHCHGEQNDVSFDRSPVFTFKGDNPKCRVKYVGCGASHNVIITDLDEIFVWGNGNSGQLGCKDLGTKWKPTPIHLPIEDRVEIAGVACGGRHTIIWLKNGHAYSFGNNFYAQLGYNFKEPNYKENQLEPKLMKFLMYRHVSQVSSGDKHTLFLFSDGTLAAVGSNAHGQIGIGSREDAVVPRDVDIDKTVTYIASGANHNLAITDDGSVFMWGYSRACGHRRHDVLQPERVLEGHHVIQVAGGATHSMALTASGNIYSWGGGIDGQLGHGNKVFVTQPCKVKDSQLTGQVVHIACGEAFSACITGDGRLYMWGKNSHTIVAGETSSYKVTYPLCLNQPLATPLESVYCGAWHAAVLTGINTRVLTEDVSESESSDDGETMSLVSQTSTSTEDPSQYMDKIDESELLAETSQLEIALPPEDHTHVSLGEFYAPTPDLTHQASMLGCEQMFAGTRSLDPESAKRLVIQVPVSQIDSSEQSSNSTPSRTVSRESLQGETTGVSQDNTFDRLQQYPHIEPLTQVPPQSTFSAEKLSSKSDVPKLRLGYNRSKTVVDSGHHTVQISRQTAKRYTLPRENTKLISRNVAFVNASDLRTTGLMFPDTACPTRNEEAETIAYGDVHTVSVEKQKQHLTAILQSQPREVLVQPPEQDVQVQRSKTFCAPLHGRMARTNTRFFYKRKPSVGQLAARNALARAQLFNPRAFERMATVGEAVGKAALVGHQTKTDMSFAAEPGARKPLFSSASSWRERRDVLNGISTKGATAAAVGNSAVKDLTEEKEPAFKINSLKTKTSLVNRDIQKHNPDASAKRKLFVKSSSLSNLNSLPRKTHLGGGVMSGGSSSPRNYSAVLSISGHSPDGCEAPTATVRPEVRTFEHMGVDKMEYRTPEVTSGLRNG